MKEHRNLVIDVYKRRSVECFDKSEYDQVKMFQNNAAAKLLKFWII